MLDLGLFRIPRFIGAVIAMFAYAAASQVMASLLPLYLQNGLGRPPLEAAFAMLPLALAMLVMAHIGRRLGRHLPSRLVLALGLGVVCAGNLVTALAAGAGRWPFIILGTTILGSGGGLLNGETQKAIMGSLPRDRASGISTTSRFSGILLGFATLSAVLAIVARSALISKLCAAFVGRCALAGDFADFVIAGNARRAVDLIPPERQAGAMEIAHRGYAAGFSASPFAATAVAGCAMASVAALMQPPRPASANLAAAERNTP